MLAQQAKDNLDNGDNNDSEFDNEVFLEDSWTDVITEVSELSQECRIQQEAIWELLMTEKNYIRKIRLIIKVFQKYLVNLQESGILTEVDPNKLFSNILEVYEANMVFWTKHLNLVVKDVRRTKQTINPLQLLDSFSNFEEIFNPYIHYCMEEANCVKYLKLLRRKNEFFVEYLLVSLSFVGYLCIFVDVVEYIIILLLNKVLPWKFCCCLKSVSTEILQSGQAQFLPHFY
ncbi:pleckstrin homology domain-containing family G member 5-like isoform X1 [Hydra vulgaris]|uniref:pleckstrin homology domain-containing family G member 5-like isoform X1 n=1 Tax=Hydra vulgaris TaxID=6087 RepID=UPI0032EA251C